MPQFLLEELPRQGQVVAQSAEHHEPIPVLVHLQLTGQVRILVDELASLDEAVRSHEVARFPSHQVTGDIGHEFTHVFGITPSQHEQIVVAEIQPAGHLD